MGLKMAKENVGEKLTLQVFQHLRVNGKGKGVPKYLKQSFSFIACLKGTFVSKATTNKSTFRNKFGSLTLGSRTLL